MTDLDDIVAALKTAARSRGWTSRPDPSHADGEGWTHPARPGSWPLHLVLAALRAPRTRRLEDAR